MKLFFVPTMVNVSALRFETALHLAIAIAALCCLLGPCSLTAASKSTVTAVYSTVLNGYTRPKLPDGTLKKEYYALARGHYSPGVSKDPSIDDVAFPQVAGVVASHLAKQGYYMAQDSKSADLLLVLTWGTTIPIDLGVVETAKNQLVEAMGRGWGGPNSNTGPINGWITQMVFASSQASNNFRSDPDPISGGGSGPNFDAALINMQAVNAMRMRADEANARLLGYNREIVARDNISRYAGNGDAYDSLISDIEEERYYVIVSAYDFKAAKNEKKEKPLWSTRVSIRVRQNRFDERLPEMIANASRYFGKGSSGLMRDESSPGTTTIRDLTILGEAPESEMSKPSQKANEEKSK